MNDIGKLIETLHESRLRQMRDALCTLMDLGIEHISYPGEHAAAANERLYEIERCQRARRVAWRLME